MTIQEVEPGMGAMSKVLTPEQRVTRQRLLEIWRLFRRVTVAQAVDHPFDEDVDKLRKMGVHVEFVATPDE